MLRVQCARVGVDGVEISGVLIAEWRKLKNLIPQKPMSEIGDGAVSAGARYRDGVERNGGGAARGGGVDARDEAPTVMP
jgi:hypothetical protein